MFDLDHIFTYHPPRGGKDLAAYNVLRQKGRELAEAIVAMTPEGEDQDHAIRYVREAVMTANASIALRGRLRLHDNNPTAEIGRVQSLAAEAQAEAPTRTRYTL